MSLQGKVALVTGASRGIGAATAVEFAKQGAAVVLAARTLVEIKKNADAINASGGKAVAIACDVSNYADVEAAVAKCEAEFGGLDILVNNAGVIDPIARLADSDPEAWSKVADINYKGVYYGLRAAIPGMEKKGSGTIINISSGAASAALEGWSHYCSTKAAVLSLTMCADKEYRDSGIRVLGLSPGTVATDMQVKIKASGLNPVSQLDPSVHIPADWPGRAIAWLCADDDSSYLGTDVSLKDEATLKKIGLVN
ncbi:MAG: SDR family oxidoreductase [Alphaproteobacteria bacterium]|jgi:NAD(P)-dependent dehydrogenase (short-subunit alcohol dehydrogenase family)|nr:SDR family oxidoreductase [Alphaproteobacteria bacterium]MBT4016484.1 SDR family oxidoreductase [Alphaproteobacteria bacterium]MBT4966878.1 SDR family oxidoreductase [Alphaproteobacteria bacterium]MBT5158822.1 SDR family oxidoreductase [Alphaproteobacteria bacterium]MBT5918749.1 SDR family oxidoreductase [Alphaproteobacteria bacterium]